MSLMHIRESTLGEPGDPLTKIQNVTINGDTLKEGNETFLVKLTTPSGLTIADTQGTGTIIDEEGRFFLSVSDPSVTEGNAGTSAMNFTVSVSVTPGGEIAVLATVRNQGQIVDGFDVRVEGLPWFEDTRRDRRAPPGQLTAQTEALRQALRRGPRR